MSCDLRCFQIGIIKSGKVAEILPQIYSMAEAVHFAASYRGAGSGEMRPAILLAEPAQIESNLRAILASSFT